MERIVIIGCGGSGKSTLAQQLGTLTGIPVIHLDKLFWKPGWVSVSQEEFDVVHEQAIAGERWILDGNFNRTMARRLERCDCVIWLDFSRTVCLLGVVKRIVTTYGKVRPDMGEGCPERINWEFLKWVWNFNANKRQRYQNMLNSLQGKEVYILKDRRQVKEFLRKFGANP